jgi:hypothetical protein
MPPAPQSYAPIRALGVLAARGVALYKGFSLIVAPGRQMDGPTQRLRGRRPMEQGKAR